MFDQTNTYGNPYGGMAPQGGYQFNGMQGGQIPKIPNVLTKEEIEELMQQTSQFTLTLTKKEFLQGKCNHRSADGLHDALVYDNVTGLATCSICKYQFRPVEPDATYDSIKDASDRIIDILQTIKIMYTDLPAEASGEFFQIIPLIGKIPQLFEFAAKNFAKHEYNAWSYNNYNMGGMAMRHNLSTMFGGGMNPAFNANPGFNGYATNPQQPVGYPNGMTPQMPGQNPFGYAGASQQTMNPNPVFQPQQPVAPVPGAYVPQSQGFSYQPGMVSGVPTQVPNVEAPKAPTPVADETVKQTVTV